MSGTNWDAVYLQYAPLLNRISSRSELPDLIRELQGELGTSHAYEYQREYGHMSHQQQGFLGVDWSYDIENNRYRIAHIVKGDTWDSNSTSPLTSQAWAGSENGAEFLWLVVAAIKEKLTQRLFCDRQEEHDAPFHEKLHNRWQLFVVMEAGFCQHSEKGLSYRSFTRYAVNNNSSN